MLLDNFDEAMQEQLNWKSSNAITGPECNEIQSGSPLPQIRLKQSNLIFLRDRQRHIQMGKETDSRAKQSDHGRKGGRSNERANGSFRHSHIDAKWQSYASRPLNVFGQFVRQSVPAILW
jgi:hypothetical protein